MMYEIFFQYSIFFNTYSSYYDEILQTELERSHLEIDLLP